MCSAIICCSTTEMNRDNAVVYKCATINSLIAERLSARHLYCRLAFVCIFICVRVYVCPSRFSAHARFLPTQGLGRKRPR